MFIDVLMVALIIGSLIIGYKMGFIKCMFRFFSGVLSFLFAIEFYKPFSRFMLNTNLFYSIKGKIQSNVLDILGNLVIKSKDELGKVVLDRMFIPNPIKESIVDDVQKSISISDNSRIAELVGDKVGTVIIQLISIILIFVLVRILFFILRLVLERVVSLPILKQINKVAGLVIGLIEGVFLVYIVLSIIFIIDNKAIIESINNSVIAKYLYYNNVILDILY